MTREEAIEILWRYDVNFEPHPPEEVMHAIDMAIEALKADAETSTFNKETSTLGEKHQLSHGRLIDADELKKHFDGAWEELNDDGERKGVRLARWYLISAPTVDSTIGVVRCKDCRFCANYTDGHRECRLLKNLKTVPCTYVLVDGNDYCSHGERREP